MSISENMILKDKRNSRFSILLTAFFVFMLGSILFLVYLMSPILKGYQITYTMILIGLILGGVTGIMTTRNYSKHTLSRIIRLSLLIGIFITGYLVCISPKIIEVFSNNSPMQNLQFGLRTGLFLCSAMLSWISIFIYKKYGKA